MSILHQFFIGIKALRRRISAKIVVAASALFFGAIAPFFSFAACTLCGDQTNAVFTADSGRITNRNGDIPCVTVKANGIVEHLFTHNLISHPEIAFAAGNSYGKNLDEDCLTPAEFRAILLALYKNDYVLVNAASTYTFADGTSRRKSFRFPEEKIPLILSFDDIVYARKNQGKGTSSRLDVISGEIVAVTENKNGEELVHKEEFAPILEDFIGEHPDFSYNNARGIIFLTGFDGVLGYRTDRNSVSREAETKKAVAVVNALKERGWVFGCHTYSHRHIKRCTADEVVSDIEKWKNEVAPIVGSTPFFAYPYGEWTFGKNGEDERQKALKNAGFEVFYGVGNLSFYTKMPLRSAGDTYLFQDRCPMDGISLRRNACARFFDCAAVYDKSRPISHI